MSDEPLGHREQPVDARLVRDSDKNRPLPNICGSSRFESEPRVLPKDRPLQLLERRARIDPELVDERPARVLVGVQRLRLPTRPVERRHQIPAQAFAERMLGDEGLELRDQLVVAPQCEVGIDAELHCCQPDLLEPGDRRLGEGLVREIPERRPSPQRQRIM